MILLADLACLPGQTPCSTARLRELAMLGDPSLKRQKRGAEALLWQAFSRACPGEAFPFDYPRTPSGKPFFPDYPDFHFSLSHTPDYALCAAFPAPCGADIEAVGRIGEAVAARVFHPIERAYLARCTPAQRPLAAAQVWCLREAYAKATGCGISGIGRDFWVLPDGSSSTDAWRFRAYAPVTGHAAAVCVRGLAPDAQVCPVCLER